MLDLSIALTVCSILWILLTIFLMIPSIYWGLSQRIQKRGHVIALLLLFWALFQSTLTLNRWYMDKFLSWRRAPSVRRRRGKSVPRPPLDLRRQRSTPEEGPTPRPGLRQQVETLAGSRAHRRHESPPMASQYQGWESPRNSSSAVVAATGEPNL
jgi:hypothetical protein